jgi:hypothetical protein
VVKNIRDEFTPPEVVPMQPATDAPIAGAPVTSSVPSVTPVTKEKE